MHNKKWKYKHKPACCTEPPWKYLIPSNQRSEILRQIRQECLDAYGYTFDECTKRFVCNSGQCLGRPLPYMSNTAWPYLQKLEETQNVKDQELIVCTNCEKCSIYNDCSIPCRQVTDYAERNKTLEPPLYYSDNIEKFVHNQHELGPVKLKVSSNDIPWDILTDKKKEIVRQYLFHQKDFRHVADMMGLYNQAVAKYEFYSSLNKLSEYGVMRKFLQKNQDKLTDYQKNILNLIYVHNYSKLEVSDTLQISPQAVNQLVSRVVKKYKIKWSKFVRKENGKIIYNVPELFK